MKLLHGVKSFFGLARERLSRATTIYAEDNKLDQLFEALLHTRQGRLQMVPVNWGKAKCYYGWKETWKCNWPSGCLPIVRVGGIPNHAFSRPQQVC